MQIFSKELLFAADDLHGVKEYTSPGVYSFKLTRRTIARIIILSSGFNRSKIGSSYSAGHSGILWIARVRLDSGIYSVKVGDVGTGLEPDTVNSYLKDKNDVALIDCNARQTSSSLDIIYGSVEKEFYQNTASGSTGGASPYMGYGKGSDAKVSNATSGYFKIEW